MKSQACKEIAAAYKGASDAMEGERIKAAGMIGIEIARDLFKMDRADALHDLAELISDLGERDAYLSTLDAL